MYSEILINSGRGRGIFLLLSSLAWNIQAQTTFPQIEAVSYSKVEITDTFWKPRIETVASVTIPVCIKQTEINTPRIHNFEKVARKKGEKHEGI